MSNYQCKGCLEPKTPVIYEGINVFVRLSNPSFCPYHILVMPKEHKTDLFPPAIFERAEMDLITCKIIDGLKKRFSELTDFILMENIGTHRGAEHFHRHIIPNNGEEPFVLKIREIAKLEEGDVHKYSDEIKQAVSWPN